MDGIYNMGFHGDWMGIHQENASLFHGGKSGCAWKRLHLQLAIFIGIIHHQWIQRHPIFKQTKEGENSKKLYELNSLGVWQSKKYIETGLSQFWRWIVPTISGIQMGTTFPCRVYHMNNCVRSCRWIHFMTWSYPISKLQLLSWIMITINDSVISFTFLNRSDLSSGGEFWRELGEVNFWWLSLYLVVLFGTIFLMEWSVKTLANGGSTTIFVSWRAWSPLLRINTAFISNKCCHRFRAWTAIYPATLRRGFQWISSTPAPARFTMDACDTQDTMYRVLIGK